jgi:hypothetical protein
MGTVKFEFENPPLQLDGEDLVWTIVNRGDEPNEPGVEIDTLQIARRSVDTGWGGHTAVDTTPWQHNIPVDAVVEPGTAHSARFHLDWPGREDGAYEARVWLQQNAHEVYAEMYFAVDHGRVTYWHG